MQASTTVTGEFEVTNKATQKKYWSKLGGQGYLDGNDTAMQQVADAIKADK
jgi:hypothetical protein